MSHRILSYCIIRASHYLTFHTIWDATHLLSLRSFTVCLYYLLHPEFDSFFSSFSIKSIQTSRHWIRSRIAIPNILFNWHNISFLIKVVFNKNETIIEILCWICFTLHLFAIYSLTFWIPFVLRTTSYKWLLLLKHFSEWL